MKTAEQLKDISLWEQAEAALEKTLRNASELHLLSMASQLSYETDNELAPLAVFALMYELHRREQA